MERGNKDVKDRDEKTLSNLGDIRNRQRTEILAYCKIFEGKFLHLHNSALNMNLMVSQYL